MNCEKCEKEIKEGARVCNEHGHAVKQQNVVMYISVALAALCVILPFCNWLEVPMAAGIYSMFGMSQEATKFSLFGYLFSGGNYQTTSMFLIMMVIALIAVIGIVFNLVYIVKSLKKKEKRYKYGTMSSVVMIIMSALFILIVGLMALILKVIQLTVVPYITLAAAIANIVLIKQLKKQSI